ncbi:probable protein phosphatase 2C 32 [Typha latifolia]|uniref:probable protein phosphatase 2C 32 n=1 Tax=Typha latifolia TaxID=4733 RepID=UPI003C2EEB31
MSCSVAIANSPVFSPSKIPRSCKGAPETLSLALAGDGSPLACPASSASPFRPRFPRVASGLRATRAVELEVASSSSSYSSASSSGGGGRSLLKRKRPARIDIPMAEAFAAAEAGSDGRREVEEESERFSVYCKRGRKRLEMEDRHLAAVDLRGDSQMGIFGIFDGHGGKKAAEFASENMGELIINEVQKREEEANCSEIEEAVRIGYLKTDSEFLKEEVGGGTCCVTALVRKGDLVVSNAGDCRAVLSRAGKAEALTSDHRPSRNDERDRIESMGGFVDFCRGLWRLQGSLAVSRGIGDSHLKQWVTPEPETKILRINQDCEFLILASDGLWDKVSNQEAVDIARPSCIGKDKSSPLSASKKLAELSTSRGSVDDVSVMIIQLQHFV